MIPVEPGIYRGLTMAEYNDLDALRSTCLKVGVTDSLRRMKKAYLGQDKKETDALTFGTMVHTLVYEPEGFDDEYFCLDETDIIEKCKAEGYKSPRSTKMYKEWLADQDKPDGRTVVNVSELERGYRVRDQIRANREFSQIITQDPEVELSIVWPDPDTGILLKARIDAYIQKYKLIHDLKTTSNLRKFRKSIVDWGYYISAALYTDGLRFHDLPVDKFVITAAESVPDWGVHTARLPDECIAIGRQQYKAVLRKLAAQGGMDAELPDYDFGRVWQVDSGSCTRQQFDYGQELK